MLLLWYLLNYQLNKKLTDKLYTRVLTSFDHYRRKHPFSADKTNAIQVADTRTHIDARFGYELNKHFEFITGLESHQRIPHEDKRYDYIKDCFKQF